MNTYHKIQTVFLRDPENHYKTLLSGQFAKDEFGYLQNNKWVFTEKVDGTNIRIQYDGKEINVRGKSNNAQLHTDLLTNILKMVEKSSGQFPKVFENPTDNPTEVCLYGEGYGAGIQKGGGNYQEEKTFVLFDIKIGGLWLERHNVEDIANQLKLPIVPIIGQGTLQNMVEWVQSGLGSRWGDFQAEGIVARPATELINRRGERVITKLKCKDFVNAEIS